MPDYGGLRGHPGFVTLFDEQIFEYKEWNPILLAIIGTHTNIVSYLLEEYPNSHLKSILSEPVS